MRPQGLEWQLMGLGSREPEHSRGYRVRKAESAFRVQSFYPTVPPKSPKEGSPFSLGHQNGKLCSAAAEWKKKVPTNPSLLPLPLQPSRAQSAESVIC